MTALLLINPQIDFCEGGALEIPGATALLKIVAAQANSFDKIICIKEGHPANHVSFAANHPWRYPGQKINFQGQELQLMLTHCVQDQFGAFLHPSCKSWSLDLEITLGENEIGESDQEVDLLFENYLKSFFSVHNYTELKLMGMVHNNIAEKIVAEIQLRFPNCKVDSSNILKYQHPIK